MCILVFQVLKSFDKIDSEEGSQIILISDGNNSHGSLPDAIQNCMEAGVVVHTIAVTEGADQRMVDISDATGGRVFSYIEQSYVSLEKIVLEIISGATVSSGFSSS